MWSQAGEPLSPTQGCRLRDAVGLVVRTHLGRCDSSCGPALKHQLHPCRNLSRPVTHSCCMSPSCTRSCKGEVSTCSHAGALWPSMHQPDLFAAMHSTLCSLTYTSLGCLGLHCSWHSQLEMVWCGRRLQCDGRRWQVLRWFFSQLFTRDWCGGARV